MRGSAGEGSGTDARRADLALDAVSPPPCAPALPPYLPDLNPIEQAFAKLKQLIRSAAPRSRERLWKTIGSTIGQFAPAESAELSRQTQATAGQGDSALARPWGAAGVMVGAAGGLAGLWPDGCGRGVRSGSAAEHTAR